MLSDKTETSARQRVECVKCKRLLMEINLGGEIKNVVKKCPKCGCMNHLRHVQYSPRYETRGS